MEINKNSRTITISQNTGLTVSLTLLIMFAGAVFTGATWLADMRNRTTNLENIVTQQQSDLSKLKATDTTNQIKFTEIQTQLKSIDTNLIEIKERL